MQTRNPNRLLFVRLSTLLSAFLGRLIYTVSASPILTGQAPADHEHPKAGTQDFYQKLVVSVILVLTGGVFAGLTLGLMGLDHVNLEVLSESGAPQTRINAVRVMKLLDRGRHWVLVCLLLSNTVVNETLPIFLDKVMGGGFSAVIVSTTMIVIFGEVIPQAVCARYGLQIGAACAPLVLALMYLEAPIAYPIAKLLDYLLGEDHGTLYKKAELKTFVSLHRRIGQETLSEDEVTIISSVLELGGKPLSMIMTDLADTYTLSEDTILDQKTVDDILAHGHSRIPIHTRTNPLDFIGMLIVKTLIAYDPDDERPVGSFALSVLPETGPDATCLDALNYFQQGRSHILLISTTPGEVGGAVGVVTLEDVIEEVIGEEIVDETDIYMDNHSKMRVVRTSKQSRVSAERALAPIIKGVIERRRTANTKPPLNKSFSAFDAIKMRGSSRARRKPIGSAVGSTYSDSPASPPVRRSSLAEGSSARHENDTEAVNGDAGAGDA